MRPLRLPQVRRQQEKHFFWLKAAVNYGTVKRQAGTEVSRFEVSKVRTLFQKQISRTQIDFTRALKFTLTPLLPREVFFLAESCGKLRYSKTSSGAQRFQDSRFPRYVLFFRNKFPGLRLIFQGL